MEYTLSIRYLVICLLIFSISACSSSDPTTQPPTEPPASQDSPQTPETEPSTPTPDEANNSPEQATVLMLGTKNTYSISVQPGVGVKRDSDWFKFEIEEPGRYKILAEGTDSAESNLLLELYTSEGVQGRNWYFQRLTMLDVALYPGLYYLEVSDGYGDYQGEYVLSFTKELPDDQASEPNNFPEQATPISLNTVNNFYLMPGDEDWFTFTIDQPTIITDGGVGWDASKGYPSTKIWSVAILDDSLTSLGSFSGYFNSDIVLGPGKYYVPFGSVYGQVYSGVPYFFRLDATTLESDAYEPNDTREQASAITESTEGAFLFAGDEDWFRLTLQKSSMVTFGTGDGLAGTVFDSNLKELSTNPLPLPSGTYYIRLTSSNISKYHESGVIVEPYEDEYEPNDTAARAAPITLDFASDSLTTYQDEDWYKITLNKRTKLLIDSSIYVNAVQVLNSSLVVLPYETVFDNEATITLASGTYLIKVPPSSSIHYYSLRILALAP